MLFLIFKHLSDRKLFYTIEPLLNAVLSNTGFFAVNEEVITCGKLLSSLPEDTSTSPVDVITGKELLFSLGYHPISCFYYKHG